MKLKTIRNSILILSFGLLCGSVGYFAGERKLQLTRGIPFYKIEIVNKEVPPDKKEIDFSLFWEVWRKLEQKYLRKEDLNPEKMVYGAISGMASSLGDPYTVFLPPKENKEAKESLNGSFEGVGIQLGFKDSQLAVIAPLKGMPAERVGVKSGDLILRIADEKKGLDEDTVGISLPEAVEKIRGPEGTKVKLTLLHEGETNPFEVEIVRDTIIVSSVELEYGKIENGEWKSEEKVGDKSNLVAWLKLYRFGDRTPEEWDKEILNIKNKIENINGVILDVRNNPGGYLEQAVNLAAEFLPPNRTVVVQENYDGTKREFKTKRVGQLPKIKLVVLVNKGSASASEILAGALRDYGRAEIVGEQTFGKGTVQEAEDLREGVGLHITTARWVLPKGKWLDEEGLKPDVEVKLEKEREDKQLEKAYEILIKS